MSKIKAIASDIRWDTDGKRVSLPRTVSLTLDTEELDDADDIGIESYVSDLLSDLYGFCHKGFSLELIKNTRQ